MKRLYQFWANPLIYEDSEDVNAYDQHMPVYFDALEDCFALDIIQDIFGVSKGNLHEVECDSLGNKYPIRLVTKW